MVNQRADRVAELIKAELGDIIQRELKDPRIGFVSITKVRVTGDLRYAKVYLSVLGSPEEKEATWRGLQSAKGFLRSKVAERVRLYHSPELQFELDDSIAYAAEIEKQLRRIRAESAIGDEQSPVEPSENEGNS